MYSATKSQLSRVTLTMDF